VSPLGIRKRWIIAEFDWSRVTPLAESAGLAPLIAHLLLLRGISTPEAAAAFLRPSIAHLSDPFLLTDMDVAVARITRARKEDELVLIFGDYDVDGISAAALLMNGLRRFGIRRIECSMPLRLSEGYGLSPEHVETAAQNGVGLIITVDNGISAHEAATRARTLGVDLIVTDHHAIENGLPEAVAVINPKREPASCPMAHLAGAGVAFKLATALNGTPNDLDIAALGTVADIVPLAGENRVIVAMGLKHMAKHNRTGLAKLAESAGLQLSGVTSERIGFQLGPRINAAGRLDDGAMALKLLLSDCPDEAGSIARLLNEANEERRAIERAIFDEAVEELEAFFRPEQRAIVLGRQGWHAGVIGIVASRILARYHRPVVLVAINEEGVGRGSARAPEGFDLVSALSVCQSHLVRFGGHKAAAGFTIEESHLSAFRQDFEVQARAQLGDGELLPHLRIDAEVSLSQVDASLLAALGALEPIGQSNPAPLLCARGVEVPPQSVRVLKDEHLRMSLRQNGRSLQGIAFGMAERYHKEGLPATIDVAFSPQFNTFRGETTIQLLIKDLRPVQD